MKNLFNAKFVIENHEAGTELNYYCRLKQRKHPFYVRLESHTLKYLYFTSFVKNLIIRTFIKARKQNLLIERTA